ncbi:actin-related protein 6-like [Panonychus citri]|uniref:actin-related protein 6-like n=1 Tax=Panonychus citri TaxID=50023 RepID=UPI002308137E|nr:actin-related protein 6-like [Panonychus citri]
MDGLEFVDNSTPIIIADIGGYSIKYGLKDSPESPQVMPNSVFKVKSERRRLYIGNQLDECKDYSGLFYLLPFNKGFPINWDVQRQVLDHAFYKNLKIEGSNKEKVFLYTEPYFNFRQVRETMLEVLYEEYGFGTLAKSVPAFLSMAKHVQQLDDDKCCLVVDSGYSFTHIVPFIGGKIVKGAIRRIDVGGKALTNHLKDIISYRQLHVLDETFVINQCKEDCCYVSNQFTVDLEIAREKPSPIARDYILPDFMTIKRALAKSSNRKVIPFRLVSTVALHKGGDKQRQTIRVILELDKQYQSKLLADQSSSSSVSSSSSTSSQTVTTTTIGQQHSHND